MNPTAIENLLTAYEVDVRAYWAIVDPLLADAERWRSSLHGNDLEVIIGIPKSQ